MNWIAKYPFTEAPDLDAGALVSLVSATTKVDGATFALRRLGVEIRDAISYQTDEGPLIILMGRVPNEETYVDQVVRKRGGVYHISAARLSVSDDDPNKRKPASRTNSKALGTFDSGLTLPSRKATLTQGRFPPNQILTEATAEIMDEQSGDRPGFSGGGVRTANQIYKAMPSGDPSQYYGDNGGASRFYPKHETLEDVIDWIRALFVGPTRVTR